VRKKFVMLAGQDVFGDITFNDNRFPHILEGLTNNPTVVEVDILSNVESGWIFNGTDFVAP